MDDGEILSDFIVSPSLSSSRNLDEFLATIDDSDDSPLSIAEGRSILVAVPFSDFTPGDEYRDSMVNVEDCGFPS